MRAVRTGALVAVAAVLLASCNADDPVGTAADAICDAIDTEASDVAAFEGYELALTRERRDGMDEDELRSALDERCGRAISAISAAAEPAPEPVEEEVEPVAEPVFTDLSTLEWLDQTWTTDCTNDDGLRGVKLKPDDELDGVHRPEDGQLTPVYVVELDNVVYGGVTSNGYDDAVFVTQCVFASAEYRVEVWSHDEQGDPLHLPPVHRFFKFDAVVDRVEAVDGLLRIHTNEGEPGDDMPHMNGYPVQVVTDWSYDGDTWSSTEVSRTDTTPTPEPDPEPAPAPELEPEPEPTSSSVTQCEDAASSQANAAGCLYSAAKAGNLDAAAQVASTSALQAFQDASAYEGFARWEFTGCGEPTLLDPPTGVSCTFYEPPIDWPHGVVVELGMGTRDGGAYIEEVTYVG